MALPNECLTSQLLTELTAMPSLRTILTTAVIAIVAVAIAKRIPLVKDFV